MAAELSGDGRQRAAREGPEIFSGRPGLTAGALFFAPRPGPRPRPRSPAPVALRLQVGPPRVQAIHLGAALLDLLEQVDQPRGAARHLRLLTLAERRLQRRLGGGDAGFDAVVLALLEVAE